MQTIQLCPPAIRAQLAALRGSLERLPTLDAGQLAQAAEAAEALGALTEDSALAAALLLKHGLARSSIPRATLESFAGASALHNAQSLLQFNEVGLPGGWSPEAGLNARQAEAVRKMLLALVSDPRLVLARLAEQLIRLRHARSLAEEERARLALEARAILAPLANRLGVWQLKWELEDLAFRYLEPAEYRRLATALNERRADRERYIEEVCAKLRAELRSGGIEAEVYGRPKHMYSIYRKMQRKHLALEQVFDLRAVRIVVATVRDCYAALGVVHGLWTYIPGEFDDYIATPKGNGYRSIHTAVAGPQGRSLEVQIRTREMHEHAELGVAAHWTYKEGGPTDLIYQRKIETVRRLLTPVSTDAGSKETDSERDVLERLRGELFEDRIYALTPKGEVVDLARGSTPLDFAYHLHTSLGHRCRGAKVNGRIVPLTTSLSNGEVVEIIAGKQEAPSRDWLAPEQGYLAAARNRAKVRAWFRKQDVGANRAAGRVIAERELARFPGSAERFAALIQELKAGDADHLYQLLGEGEITVTQLLQAAGRVLGTLETEPPQRRAPRAVRPRAAARASSPVELEGVGDLPITLARCCAPLPPQPICGYVTLGRGVTVHRTGCPSLRRMRSAHPDRVLSARWTAAEGAGSRVEIAVRAQDRRALVRDVTDVLALERLNIETLNTTTDRVSGTAHVSITLAVKDLEQLERVLQRLTGVPSVIYARRVG